MVRAIRASWLIDGLSSSALEDAVVLIDGERIVDVGPERSLPLGPGVEVFDAKDCTVLPGLVDCHVHLSLNGKPTEIEDMIRSTNDQVYEVGCENAARALAAGITTVRDCGARDDVAFHLKDSIESGRVPGPQVMISGVPLTSVRGHFHFMNGEVAHEEAAIALLNRQLDDGADFVKVMASGGGITPGTDPRKAQFTASQLSKIAEEAARRGTYVTAHCHATEAIASAAVAGLKGIEHCTFLGPTGNSTIDEKVLQLLVDHKTTVMLTLSAEYFITQTPAKTTMIDPSPDAQKAYLAARFAAAKAIWEAGVPLAAGSDACVPGSRPDALRKEIELLMEIGLPKMEALQTATSKAAKFLGLDDRGVIAKGKRADLLVVIGNPLDDIRALSQPILVMKNGGQI